MKVVDTATLKKLANRARLCHLSRLLPKSVEKILDPDGLHVLSQPIFHNDIQCIRALVVLLKLKDREDAVEGQLDFDIDEWNRLPEHVSSKVLPNGENTTENP